MAAPRVGQPTLDGRTLFGAPCRMAGPDVGFRAQREYLPGVTGFRQYRLGGDSRAWVVRGRITASTFRLLQTAINFSQNYIDGRFYTFTDNAALSYPNCTLTSFHPVGPYQAAKLSDGTLGVTVEVEGHVEQASP